MLAAQVDGRARLQEDDAIRLVCLALKRLVPLTASAFVGDGSEAALNSDEFQLRSQVSTLVMLWLL
jgi:hypothetical protein